ncbi:MAG TPA: OsmC family protein [Kofleriaceae bacterium]|nr:OsmC family protein [Kofleriaceae bacterium]
MKLTVQTRTLHDASTAVGWSGPRTVTIDRPREAGGLGLGFNGGELLFLAVAACYSNDIYREAARMGIAVRSVDVEVTGEFGGDPVRAQNVTYSVTVAADAPPERVRELIEHTDRVAEVHNSLRLGTPVRLDKAQVG